MRMDKRLLSTICLLATQPLYAPISEAAPVSPETIIKRIDLSGPFGASPGWQFVAMQGPEIADPIGAGDEQVPGEIRLCLSKAAPRACVADLQQILARPEGPDAFSDPHFLNDARIVEPAASARLLLLQVASLRAVNGDQRVATELLAYDKARDGFVSVYKKQTGRNNNQEIRYIASGPLRGGVISAEPTTNAPFGFWITVNRLTAGRYAQVLKYRSATRYGDGNSLAVIDSEMPAIERRLGYWRPGMLMPLPQGGCRRPHLVHDALWC